MDFAGLEDLPQKQSQMAGNVPRLSFHLGETVPSFAGAGIVAFGIISYYIVMILSALVLAVLVIINIYAAYRNLLTDSPLEN